MQRNFQFMAALRRGQWAIEEGALQELLPLADSYLAGRSPQVQTEGPEPTAQIEAATTSGEVFRMGYYQDLDKVPAGSVAVIAVNGVVMKYGMCGLGTMARAQLIDQAAAHANIAGILVEFDTPGGQVAGLNTFNDSVRNARKVKPVLGLINDGGCYSAGYHGLSACQEAYATHATSGVGSIGTMCQLRDYSAANAKAGIKDLVVYATKSTRKNAKFREALAGKPDALVAELDVLNEDFHAHIDAARGAKIKDRATAYNGDTWTAAEGVAMGLLDGILTKQQAIARVLELAGLPPDSADRPPLDENDEEDELDDALNSDDDGDEDDAPNPNALNSNPNPTTDMAKYALIAALCGVAAADFNTTAEGSHLNVAHLDAIEAALASNATAAADLVGARAELATAQGLATTTGASLTKANARVKELEAELLDSPAGGGPKVTGQEEEPKGPEAKADLTAWEKLDADMLNELNADRRAMGLAPLK